MPKHNLLLCFDAFGTLFWPKLTVAQQYGHVARQCGMTGWTEGELQSRLAAAFKDEARRNPNYGKTSGLGATQWWTNVIFNTFQPFARHQPLPADLAPRILERFSSSQGYHVEQDLVNTIKSLKQRRSGTAFDRVVVGVITNSDDRVPGVLSSFGLSISPLRYGSENKFPVWHQSYDIDFTCMSYDAGVEKPHAAIFRAAEHLCTQVLSAADKCHISEADICRDEGSWHRLYVGDEYAKDVMGALNAGWSPVLLDQHDKADDMPGLEQQTDQSITNVFQRSPVVKVRSIRNLVSWLLGVSERGCRRLDANDA
ncbi:hypothetical protein E4U19_002442 [Claviceps sp. Clav32 group G5]|nr:hypothetical protein E4U19_002442 [Claviceps sp. Clav32 group G5]KAG6046036.1 hypothetical protein E4U39_001735 [Claviceps sp. Clav50 group G5]